MKKIIIITYESGKKEALIYQLDALEFIETNFAWIVDIEIIDVLECDQAFWMRSYND
jgi:hypothetical protein